MASVTFEDVTKRFGDVVAVDHLDLAVDDGEFMVLLGPSGCGKTTALRMVAGLEIISDGSLRIGDQVVNDVDPARRDVSMVFQSYALYPHMTVERNIDSPLRVRKYHADGPEAPSRKLTRAFVGRPKAFLMDEPLSNLDAKLRAQTRTELVELHQRVATTVIYVTHDQVEAITMATRVAIMSAGHLQQVGTPQEVYEAPANLFVAQFIGTPPMNTLPGTFTSEGGPAIVAGESRFPVPKGLTTRLEEGQALVVGARPEHLEINPEGTIAHKVRAVEWLGHECLVMGAVGGNPVTVRQVGMAPEAAESTIRLTVDPVNVHVFDPATTDRLP